MFKDPAKWASRGVGGFFGALVFLALTFMADSVSPSSATPGLQLFFGFVAIVSLVAWGWGSYPVWINARNKARAP